MKVGVYLDLSDLYHRVNRKYGRKLNFAAALDDIKLKYPADVHVLRAYGIQRGNEAAGFIACLDRLGFDAQFKRPEIIRCGDREIKRANWDCAMAVDVLRDHPDIVILGSGSNTFAELARFTVDNHKQFIAFGTGIGKELRGICTSVIEITEAVLE
jgi:hypothetical protein